MVINSIPSSCEHYFLTWPQQLLMNDELLKPGTNISTLTCRMLFEEVMDMELLSRAVNLVIKNNAALRLRMVRSPEGIKQYFAETYEKEFEIIDFSDQPRENFIEWEQKYAAKAFPDIFGDSLVNFTLVKTTSRESGFFIKAHHVISDAWSLWLVINHIESTYRALRNGLIIDNHEKPSYLEYIKAEAQYYSSNRYLLAKKFWEKEFSRNPPLPYSTQDRVKKSDFLMGRAERQLGVKTTKNIKQFCQSHGTTESAFMLSLISIALSKFANTQDLTIGVPMLNRLNPREKQTVGDFINMIAYRFSFDSRTSFESYLSNATKKHRRALRHQRFPIDNLNTDGSTNWQSQQSFYDVVVSFQTISFKMRCRISPRWYYSSYQYEPLFISISDREALGNYLLEVDYRLDIFNIDEIDHLFQLLAMLLEKVLLCPTIRLDAL